MKWIRMLGLFFEEVFEYRLRSFIWLLLPLINNLILILFWNGAGMNTPSISTYYMLITVVGLLTTSHTEFEVSEVDIKQGQLVNYLTKPISYFWIKLFNEIPYRLLQGVYASLIIVGLLLFFPHAFVLSLNPIYIPLVLLIFSLGYVLSYTLKLSLGYLSFWFTDINGLMELVTIVMIIFSGSVMPLLWYPKTLQIICNILPFAYSGYYLVTALQGSVPFWGLCSIILIQGAWLGILLIINKFLWINGSKEFTAVGQ